MVTMGLEPTTLTLLVLHSNQLSYATIDILYGIENFLKCLELRSFTKIFGIRVMSNPRSNLVKEFNLIFPVLSRRAVYLVYKSIFIFFIFIYYGKVNNIKQNNNRIK